MANFSGSFISDTYQRVLQLDTTLQDGTGSLLQDLPITASHAISASYAVSASVEILKEISSSNADTASYVEYTGIANKPTLLSSSAQIADDISGSFTSTSASLASDITSHSASVATDIAALVVDSGSFSTRVTDLEIFSSSLDDTFVTETELNTVTSSLSSSLAIDITTNITNISANSSSIVDLTAATSSYSTGSGESIFSSSIAITPTSSGVLEYWNLSGSIIPTENEQYDLGNAEYKIRHLFLSDNSIFVGDNHVINAESLDNQLGLTSSIDPILPNSPGNKGDIVTDTTHVYICIDPNIWVRTVIETGW